MRRTSRLSATLACAVGVVVSAQAAGVPSQWRLVGSDTVQGDEFGFANAVDGDTVVVGALEDSQAAPSAGAASVFVRAGASWSQLRKITAVDAGAGDKFGLFLALSGDTAVAGAPLHGDPAQDAGSSYVLEGVSGASAGGTGAVESFLLPQKITVKSGGADGTSTITASGIFDTGPNATTLGGPARLDIGPIDIVVPSFVRRGRTLTFAGDGVKFALAPSSNGSSKATFKLTYKGVRAAGVAADGPVALSFRLASVKGAAVVKLAGGRFVLGKSPGGLVEPTVFVVSAGATLRGPGRDALSTVVGYAGSGAASASPPPDLTMAFGSVNFTLTGARFAPAGGVLKFVGDERGIKRVVIDDAKGTVSVTGAGLSLGDYARGGNAVPITVRIGTDERAVQVRMGRTGARLKY